MNQSAGPEQSSDVRCIQCGYDLTSVTIGGTCPECGRAVMPSFQARSTAATSNKAVASLVLGICSIAGCMMYGLPAVICGPLAIYFYKKTLQDIAMQRADVSSLGMAKAGLVTGIIGTVLGVLALGYVVVLMYWIWVF